MAYTGCDKSIERAKALAFEVIVFLNSTNRSSKISSNPLDYDYLNNQVTGEKSPKTSQKQWNLSDEEKRDFALAKAMEIYDAEHQGLENERLPQNSEPTVLTGRVEYNEEEENQAQQKPLTEAQIDNLARELAEFDESGETIGAFLSALENDVKQIYRNTQKCNTGHSSKRRFD